MSKISRSFQFLIVLLFWSGQVLSGQICCPYINALTILPGPPIDSSASMVIVDVSTPSQGARLALTHSIQGQNIHIEACYYSGLLPAIGNYVDTLVLGILPAGRYRLDFMALMSSDPQHCNDQDSNQIGLDFTVYPAHSGIGLVEQRNPGFSLYPQPAHNYVYLHSRKGLKGELRVLDARGKVLYRRMGLGEERLKIDLSDWPEGLYWLEMNGKCLPLMRQ